jgi:hypothetical protein
MRKNAALVLTLCTSLVSLVGCAPPEDTTMNRPGTQTDPNYPPEPYGYTEGSVVENYKFLGKIPADGAYAPDVREIRLGEFHQDPAARLLLIVGSANWCYFCNEEAPANEALAVEYADRGYRSMTVLAEGYTRGVPSNADDIRSWTEKFDYKQSNMAIDPEGRMFQYAPASAFPLHILLDTQTMKINWLCVGGQGACDVETAVADAVGAL